MVNKLKKINFNFHNILTILSDLSNCLGFKIYLVGGVVRDLLLGEDIFDLDVVVEGDAIVFAQKVAQTHNKNFKRHHAFGTATVYFDKQHIDFVTARRETYASWGVLPRVEPATLREDLLRRDFTVNAMAVSLNKDDYGNLVDFYKGRIDLRKGLIRVLHKNSFLDDPTRILRAIRFEQRFSFRIEARTLRWAKESISLGGLGLVSPHRLRDELVLVLKEKRPYRYIKRIDQLGVFTFIHKKFKLTRSDLKLISNIEKTVSLYKKKFKKHRKLEEWLIYLTALLIRLPHKDISQFLESFGLKKGERIRILSIYKNIHRIKRLDSNLKPHMIYRLINPLSFESILFFYAYYPQRRLRKNIELFLDILVHMRLQVKGEDLKGLGCRPHSLYGKILEKILYAKIDKGFMTKKEEIELARLFFEKLSKKVNQPIRLTPR
ncbi:MAG: CCA tRNA nucleotidyltransferase [Candidatus Omnitrophota bacterium]|nr:CCA tRNA nucleotidyltransferase [Candidatus Omnitrophota bacterium]